MEGYAAFKNETGIVMTGGVLEGPELFKFNGEDKWGLYSDNYGKIGYAASYDNRLVRYNRYCVENLYQRPV